MILKAYDVTILNLEKCNLDNIISNLDKLRLGIGIIKNDTELKDITYESIKIYFEEYHNKIIEELKRYIYSIKCEIDNAKLEVQNVLLSSKELDTSQIPQLNKKIIKLKNTINFLSYFAEEGKLIRKYESMLKTCTSLKQRLEKVKAINSKYKEIFAQKLDMVDTIAKRISMLCSWIGTGKTSYDKDEYKLNFNTFNYELYMLYDEIINLPIDKNLKLELFNNKLNIIQNMPFNINSDEEIINKYISVQREYIEALESLGVEITYLNGVKPDNYEIPEEVLDGKAKMDCSGLWHMFDEGMLGSNSSFKYPMHKGSRGGGTGSDLNIARQIEEDALIPILSKDNITQEELNYIQVKYNYNFSEKDRKLLLNNQMEREELVKCVEEIVDTPVDHVIKEGQELNIGSTLIAKGNRKYDHVMGIVDVVDDKGIYMVSESRSFTTESGVPSGVGIRAVNKETLTYVNDPNTNLFNENTKNRYVIEAPERIRCLYNHNEDTIDKDVVR